jgi:hypothetical protein
VRVSQGCDGPRFDFEPRAAIGTFSELGVQQFDRDTSIETSVVGF